MHGLAQFRTGLPLIMVTIKQIATAVGVSSATVSRVLNFDKTLSVSAQTRKSIIETAEALNYSTPRNRNRALVAAGAGATKVAMVHFLRPEQELADPYYVGLRLGIESRCAALKIETVKIYHTDEMPDPKTLQASSGVIAIGVHEPEEVAWLKRQCRSIIFADFAPEDDSVDSVHSDRALAMRKLVAALTAAGYKRIGFAGWWRNSHVGDMNEIEERGRAFITAQREAGRLDEDLCAFDANTEESGYHLTRRLLSRADRPDALITGNDNMAVGAYRAIHEMGLSIPDDIAVASFNDISVAQFLNPPLSTVRLPSEEIGETAVDLLVERLAGRELAKQTILASQMIWRGSTRRPAGK
jgi:LacI family transcriptional regulator